MKTTINTGALELRGLYQRYVTEGLMLAGLFHLTLIGGYQIYSDLTKGEIVFPKTFKSNEMFLFNPPLHQNTYVVPNVQIAGISMTELRGNPVPVPETEYNINTTLVENTNLTPTAGIETGDPNGTSVIDEHLVIVDETPPPPFRAVEKQPIPVNSVYPPYPEIARRAGVEGMVHVNMWVTKEGKVKKAEIVKTTNDLFNQASIDAAMQWTFTPAIMNNGPVSVWVTVPFKFKLTSR